MRQHWKFFGFVVVLASMTGCTRDGLSIDDAQGAAPWPMLGQGPMHQSRSPRLIHDEREVSRSWDYQVHDSDFVDGGVFGDASPVIAADGTIYFATKQHLHALTAGGAEKWTAAINSPLASPAIGRDGTVYACDGTHLVAFAPTGAVKWRADLGVKALGSPILLGDALYLTTTVSASPNTNGGPIAIALDGTIKWRASAGDYVSSPVATQEGLIVTMGVDSYIGELNGYHVENGALAFGPHKHRGVYFYNDYPVAGTDGSIYAAGEVFSPTGVKSATALSSDSDLMMPAIGGDGTLYVPLQSAGVSAINPDGSKKWSWRGTDRKGARTIAVGADGRIYFGAEKLYILGMTGELERSIDVGSPISSRLAIDSDGTVIFGAANGKLYARQ